MTYEKYKIYRETDYDMFDMHEFNRDTHESKELYASMRKHGFHWQNAIACIINADHRLKIIQGHNRFVVAKALGLPIYFTVEKAECAPDVHELEPGNKHWSVRNYVEAFSRAGRSDYQFVKQYAEETGIPLGQLLAMFTGQAANSASNQNKKIRHGRYQIKTTELAYRVAHIVAEMQKAGIKWANKSGMVRAICVCCMWKPFNEKRFLDKARKHHHLFESSPLFGECLQQCENVYNHCTSNKVPLAFNAQQAAKERKLFAAKKKK